MLVGSSSLLSFSYLTDLQGSQTIRLIIASALMFSYLTDLQGSQTKVTSATHVAV